MAMVRTSIGEEEGEALLSCNVGEEGRCGFGVLYSEIRRLSVCNGINT